MTRAIVTELGEGESLRRSPVTQTSRTQGFSPADYGKLHPQSKRWKPEGTPPSTDRNKGHGGDWVTRPSSRSSWLYGASQEPRGPEEGQGSYLVLSLWPCSQEQPSSSQWPARSKK